MIEVRSLSRYYGEFAAIEDISFDIRSNEVVGFLGLNGAGKSTTLKILAGLLAPSEGSVMVDGSDLLSAPSAFRARIGYLPEEPPLYREMTVSEFLAYLAELRGMDRSITVDRLPEVLSLCQLSGQADRIIGELSMGFRKRVGIAQAIVHAPKLVILDEPISGLDPYQIVEMRDLIRNLSKECTVLLSSHNLNEVSETCDRLLVLDHGRMVAQGSATDLSAQTSLEKAQIEAMLVPGGTNLSTELEALEAVASFQIAGEESAEAVPVRISLQAGRPEDLVAQLVGKGIGVRSVSNSQSELEKIFLSLTQEGQR